MSIILSEADAKNISNDIREEFDQEFAKEKKINNIFQNDWKNEDEVLDAVEESKRLRNKNFEEDEIPESKVPTKTEKVKIKKKKRFFFF